MAGPLAVQFKGRRRVARQFKGRRANALHDALRQSLPREQIRQRNANNVSQLTRGKTQTSSNPSRKSAGGKISNGPP